MHHFIISMILVCWLSQAQGKEIYPAMISAAINGGKLEFTCSTYRLNKMLEENGNFYIYLCKNGFGIDVIWSCHNATFIIYDIAKDDTGHYSCVFSANNYNLKDITGNVINSIFITVNDSYIPAKIALRETSVKTGSDVEFQCTSLKLPVRNQTSNIYAYLYKNSSVIQMNIWDTAKNEARFTLKEVTMRDAGTYACVLMSEPCPIAKKVQVNEEKIVREINLYITDPDDTDIVTYGVHFKRNVLRLFFSAGVIIFACYIVIFDIKTRSCSSS